MTRLRWACLALGLLGSLAALAAARSSLAGGAADSPEARLKSRIADLQVEVAVLDVEVAAARENLLESLKELGHLELGDKKTMIREIQDEMDQANMLATARDLLKDVPEIPGGEPSKPIARQNGPVTEPAKGAADAKQVPGPIAESEWKERLAATRAQADRMKADFQKKVRVLQQKKLELAEAEAEYKATR